MTVRGGHVRVLVLGAGLTGLSCANHLGAEGDTDHLVVEVERRPGGWAKTDWTGPWGADRGVHALYFRDNRVQAWVEDLLSGRWVEHRKACLVESRGVRTPFPFHANLFGRDPAIVEECLAGLWAASLRQAAAPVPPVTFADWIDQQLGSGVRRHFMDPYNTKMWTVPPTEMGCDWMGRFIPSVEPERILAGALRRCDSRIGMNERFYYPVEGISALPDALARRSGRIRYGVSVVAVDPERRRVTLSDRSVVTYEWLVSTLPLAALVRLLSGAPAEVSRAVDRLETVDLVTVDIGFSAPVPMDVHWVYFPDDDVLGYRLHLAHAFSATLAPSGHGLYCVEISHSRHRPLPSEPLVPRVVDDLLRTGWLTSPAQVVFTRQRFRPNAYVLPRVGFRDDAETVQQWLAGQGIVSSGRYGEWTYSNMEDALLSGRAAATLVSEPQAREAASWAP